MSCLIIVHLNLELAGFCLCLLDKACIRVESEILCLPLQTCPICWIEPRLHVSHRRHLAPCTKQVACMTTEPLGQSFLQISGLKSDPLPIFKPSFSVRRCVCVQPKSALRVQQHHPAQNSNLISTCLVQARMTYSLRRNVTHVFAFRCFLDVEKISNTQHPCVKTKC